MKQHYLVNNRRIVRLKDGVNETDYIKKIEERGGTVEKIKAPPTIKTLEKWQNDGICKTPCGCTVEPDGTCHHGKPSWLMLVGVV